MLHKDLNNIVFFFMQSNMWQGPAQDVHFILHVQSFKCTTKWARMFFDHVRINYIFE